MPGKELLAALPAVVAGALRMEAQMADWAAKFAPCEHALFLGRGAHYPIATEGALKLKEISVYPRRGLRRGRGDQLYVLADNDVSLAEGDGMQVATIHDGRPVEGQRRRQTA